MTGLPEEPNSPAPMRCPQCDERISASPGSFHYCSAGHGFGVVMHPGREPECLHGVATSGYCYECASATLKDSGTRREFATGAVRDGAQGKGRFDLNPIYGELLIAQQMEAGAAKYSARNWEQGMPLSVFANSAKRHLAKLIAGFDDEPHLAAALWNLSCLAEGQKRIELGLWPKSLDDLPKTYAGQDPGF